MKMKICFHRNLPLAEMRSKPLSKKPRQLLPVSTSKFLTIFLSEKRITPTHRRKQKIWHDGSIRLKQSFPAIYFMSSENNWPTNVTLNNSICDSVEVLEELFRLDYTYVTDGYTLHSSSSDSGSLVYRQEPFKNSSPVLGTHQSNSKLFIPNCPQNETAILKGLIAESKHRWQSPSLGILRVRTYLIKSHDL